ncbi:calcium, potassium:sodium antiporter [Aureococcus anophagefferens]|nr:calcium, potassium:sodium antiporter [Aureococcus anophagefferens]
MKRLEGCRRRNRRRSDNVRQAALVLVGLVSLALCGKTGAAGPGPARRRLRRGRIGRRAPRRFRAAARRLGAAADALEDPGARRLANATADDDDDDETGGLIIGGARIPPKPLLTKKQNLYYGWFFYVLGILWMFLGLAFVCDVYLEASLEGICTGLKLSNDVAGATFMAAGGSAPELCTSFIGVFVERSDIGFGTIVGSAVFNVLFVIAAARASRRISR